MKPFFIASEPLDCISARRSAKQRSAAALPEQIPSERGNTFGAGSRERIKWQRTRPGQRWRALKTISASAMNSAWRRRAMWFYKSTQTTSRTIQLNLAAAEPRAASCEPRADSIQYEADQIQTDPTPIHTKRTEQIHLSRQRGGH